MKAHLKIVSTALIVVGGLLKMEGQTVLDTSFDPGTGGDGLVESTLVQPDGKVLICGNFTTFNGTAHAYMARLNSDGSVDQSFNASPGYWVRHMALQPDGKIVIGGFFNDIQGIERHRIARLNSDGSLDTSFNPGSGCEGKIVPVDPTEPFVFAVAVQPDGKIVVGGNFVTYNGVTNIGIVRLNSDGSIDSGFHTGQGVNSWVRSILIQSNGQVMLTGWFTSYDNQPYNRMVRLNTDGTPDNTFNPNFGELTAVYTVVPLANGQYIAAGHDANTNNPGYYQREIVRLNADGTFDKSFAASANEKVESIRLQSDGKIVMGGYFSRVDGQPRYNLARLNADGTLDTSFTNSTDNFVWTVALQSDGRILFCGGFSTVDGVSRNRIARLGTPGSVGNPDPTNAPLSSIVFQTAAGQVQIWPNSVASNAITLPFKLKDHIAAVNDFNNDGQPDFVTQNSKGVVSLTLLSGTNILSTNILDGQPNARVWHVVASGDFDNDGQKDLLLQGPNHKLSVWFLNNGSVTRTNLLNGGKGMPAIWHVAGVEDFNNDGQLDVLWQNSNGGTAVWFLSGTNVTSTVKLRGGTGPSWQLRAIGDFTGDGQPDFLWQSSSGLLLVWRMDQANHLSSSFFRSHNKPAWRVVGSY